MTQNRQILLDNRPTGEAGVSNFRLVSSEVPPLQDGQVLVRNHYRSLDPYTVSYTHLDVYKRQASTTASASARDTSSSRTVSTASGGMAIRWR